MDRKLGYWVTKLKGTDTSASHRPLHSTHMDDRVTILKGTDTRASYCPIHSTHLDDGVTEMENKEITKPLSSTGLAIIYSNHILSHAVLLLEDVHP